MQARVALCVVVTLLLVACSGASSEQTNQTVSSPPNLTKTKDGLTVTLSYEPTLLKVGVPTRLNLKILDEQNRPVTDAAIAMDLSMLGMSMEKNQPKVENKGDGMYMATANFTMGGNTWVVDLRITRAGKTTQISFTSLDIRE